MKAKRKSKPFPEFTSDQEAEDFLDNADLTQYDFSGFEPMQFEFSSKSARLNMRLPDELLDRIKSIAVQKKMPYTRYIRLLIEREVAMDVLKEGKADK